MDTKYEIVPSTKQANFLKENIGFLLFCLFFVVSLVAVIAFAIINPQ